MPRIKKSLMFAQDMVGERYLLYAAVWADLVEGLRIPPVFRSDPDMLTDPGQT
jgi:hypothetical protein